MSNKFNPLAPQFKSLHDFLVEMGRRSTKTTKAGKFMNPTDQWRKQQRKKELKKNKKTRQVVREAVLRMKDVGKMLEEIEEIEKIEIESLGGAPQPNEKGLQEKKENFMAQFTELLSTIEDPKKAHEIKLMIMDSENRRREMSKVYNSYRAARSQYSIDEIPMPGTDEGESLLPSDIPMPSALGVDEEEQRLPGLIPPGPPPGPPPKDIPDYNVVESGAVNKSVRFAGFDSDSDSEEHDSSNEESNDEAEREEGSEDENDDVGATPAVPPGPPPGLPPGVLQIPPMVRAPPPAPPGPPPLFGTGFPPRVGLPPGPPPGVPPPQLGIPPKPLIHPNPSRPHIQSGAILSAPPTRNVASSSESSTTKPEGAIISAQPQLRNMTAEVTKFMPTSLRVRRDQPTASRPKPRAPVNTLMQPRQLTARQTKTQPKGMQGDAYEAFMKEMQGLL